ncbi:MAG: PDZ domain-containing protein [Butyricicoccus pullicaecorum]|nr:PDZ domain-containing protein [Butyricicoccus pullicaecorum]
MSKNVSRGTAAALCALTAVTAVAVSYIGMERRLEALLPDYKTDAAIYGKIGEIRRTVDAYYVGQYDQQEAVDDAAAGFVVGVGDRWSSYMSAEEYQAYKLSFSGQSFGIGLYTAYDADQNELRIVEVFPGSDGEALGLQKGDFILGAEGKTVEKDGYSDTIAAVAGEEGTKASVTIQRAATGEVETVEMERKTTDTIMAAGHMLKDGQTGFVRIYNFRRGSEKQVREQVKKLTAEGAKRLIFDVRNNPGGSVDSVCDALDALLPEGKIMTLRTKAGKETVYESDKNEVDLPMAVLVNADSISAAEFFAAALQEYGKAVVIGEQTIGKGYSQQNYELSDGSALHLSDQEYFTPNGKSLIGTGVTPDVQSSPAEGFNLYFTPQEDDVQLQAALAALGA